MSRSQFGSRTAFTLVELLVVIAVIGVLVGLLLPAVQAAREAARRMQCANNLKQLALAVHNYESAHGAFPLTTTGPSRAAPPLGSGFYSWMAMLLPQIEQAPLYNSIQFNQPMVDDKNFRGSGDYTRLKISANHVNAAAAATRIASLLCPSDFADSTASMGTAQPAPGSYAGNIGWIRGTSGIDGSSPALRQSNGSLPLINPLSPNPWQVADLGFQSVTDGTAFTALLGERLINNAEGAQGPFGTTMEGQLKPSVMSYCGGGGSSNRSLPSWVSYCDGVSVPDPTYSLPHGRSWISGWTLVANLYMHVMPINTRNCHVYGGEDDGTNIVTASSNHTGGAQIAFVDGHVTFVSDNIDPVVWWSIGSRNGGETMSDTP